MSTRKASATWEGDLQAGKGSFTGETGTLSGAFTVGSRFGADAGTNPEELLAAAHASCFSMALSAGLSQAGHPPKSISTTAACTIEKVGEGFEITSMKLTLKASVPGLDQAGVEKFADAAKAGCPVSKALAGVPISLEVLPG
ncbi:MAG: OsmC family protein [Gemmatimonadota bacterium]|jgi:osmotically inducible protein OsmC|nr:OsmC family protein [Gemmatimonadota bacterium]